MSTIAGDRLGLDVVPALDPDTTVPQAIDMAIPDDSTYDPPVAGSEASSTVAFLSEPAEPSGAGGGADGTLDSAAIPPLVIRTEDEELLSLGIFTPEYLKSIGSRYYKPTYLSNIATMMVFDKENFKITHHHMIPLPKIVELWTTLRKAHLKLRAGSEPHNNVQAALLALIQLTRITSTSEETQSSVLRPELNIDETTKDTYLTNLRGIRFNESNAIAFLLSLNERKIHPTKLSQFLSLLMWMDFNLILGPDSREREDDPGSTFDNFEGAIRNLKTSSKRPSAKESEKLKRLEKRIQSLSKLNTHYKNYSKSLSQFNNTRSPNYKMKMKMEEASSNLDTLCKTICTFRDWAQTQGTLLYMCLQKNTLEKRKDYEIQTVHREFGLTFSMVDIERKLWEKNPETSKWRKVSPTPSLEEKSP